MKMGTDWPVNRPMYASKMIGVETRIGDLAKLIFRLGRG